MPVMANPSCSTPGVRALLFGLGRFTSVLSLWSRYAPKARLTRLLRPIKARARRTRRSQGSTAEGCDFFPLATYPGTVQQGLPGGRWRPHRAAAEETLPSPPLPTQIRSPLPGTSPLWCQNSMALSQNGTMGHPQPSSPHVCSNTLCFHSTSVSTLFPYHPPYFSGWTKFTGSVRQLFQLPTQIQSSIPLNESSLPRPPPAAKRRMTTKRKSWKLMVVGSAGRENIGDSVESF